MAVRLRPHLPALAGALVGIALITWLSLIDFAWSDYDTEAAPAFKALAEGHLGRFLQLCPSYGGSLVLRAPVAGATALLGGGELAVWRAGSIACLAAAAIFAVWLCARMRADGLPRLARAAAVGLIVASPSAAEALEMGHPEELLGGVLCVAAVIAASRRRPVWAGLLLGLAIATKAWGLLAVGPVLVALPAGRWKALLISGAVAAVVLAPIAIGSAGTFRATTVSMHSTGVIFQPWQAWWFLGETGHVVRGLDGHVKPDYRVSPAWLVPVTHPLIILLGGVLTALWALCRRGAARGGANALLLLALLLHLRCLLDPWNTTYYALPSLLALLGWETLARRQPPVLTLVGTVLVWITFREPRLATADAQALLYLAWSVPVAVLLAAGAFAPARLQRLGRRRPSGAPLAHASTG